MSAVLAAGPGFVAVGYQGGGAYECEELTDDGRAWTSVDGEHWMEWRPEALAGLTLTLAANADGTVYAFGFDCPNGAEKAVVRSTDGTNWERLQPDLPDDVWIDVVGASGGTLIALGGDRSWTSADGAHWQRAGEVPFSYSWFAEIETLGGTSIAFDNNATNPASFSEDAGESWSRADFGPVYNLRFYDAVAVHERIVAAASACCALPRESAGVMITSTDGEHWEVSGPFHDVPQAVVGITNGYMAIGRTTWVSRDGLDWRVGPRLPELDWTREVTAVSADAGVLVINADVAWFAPSGEIALNRWTDTPRAPEMPEIGVRYPYELFLHCGWDAIYFGLRTWMPDPPFLGEHAVNPPPGFGDADRGWLTQLRDNELQYESRRGPKVTLRPSDPVEWDGPCA